MDEQIGIALIGFGRMGRIHFTNLISNCKAKLFYVADELTKPAQEAVAKQRLGYECNVVQPKDISAVWNDVRVKAVVISTQTTSHEAVILSAIAAGKHVFVEKPVTLDVESTRLCYAAAQAKNLCLFCGFMKRFDSSYRKLADGVKQGRIGHPQLAIACVRDHPEPVQAVGAGLGSLFMDMAIHNIDLISWIVSEFPTEVAAMGHAHKDVYKQAGNLDTFGLMVKFPSGLIAYIDSCRYAPYGYDQRVEIIGNKGALLAENLRPDNVVYRNPEGDHQTPIDYSFPERFRDAYKAEINCFLDIAAGGSREQVVTEAAAVKTMEVVLAAEQSFQSKAIVTVSYS